MRFDFEPQEADLILRCMAKQPYEVVAGVIAKIQVQFEKGVREGEKSELKTVESPKRNE